MGALAARPLARSVPWLVLAAGLAVTIAATILWAGAAQREREGLLDRAVADARRAVESELGRYEEGLRAAAGALGGPGALDGRRFRRVAASLERGRRLVGTDGLLFVARVPRGRERAFVNARRASGDHRFSIREAPLPAVGRSAGDRFVTTFAVPATSWASIGFDLGSLAPLRGALKHARDSGRPALTPRFTPFLDRRAARKQDGFALFAPVYGADATKRHRAELRGFVATRFPGDRFMPAMLGHSARPLRWKLFDGPDPERATELAHNDRAGPLEHGLSRTVRLQVAGREWSLRGGALAGFVSPRERAEPVIIAALGAVLSLLLFALVRSVSQARLNAEDLVEALRENEQRFRKLAASSPVGIFQARPDGTFAYANARFREILGVSPSQPVDEAWRDALEPDDRIRVTPSPSGEGGTPSAPVRVRLRRPDGSQRRAESRTAALYDDGGAIIGLVGTLEDVTEREEVEAQLSYQALHDALTGLANRFLFLDRVGLALTRAGRGEGGVAVLFLDLDRFKLVNDSLGHDAGDELLTVVAGRLDSSLRPGDTVARLGGDEFAIVCDVDDERDATGLADRIARALEVPIKLRGSELVVSASIGIALARGSTTNAGDLLQNADAAMYRAKDRGKARVEVFDESMRARTLERLHTESALRLAIERGELVVHYQPEVRLDNGLVVGFEALVRWDDPARGRVGPSEFIPAAEETGLIVPIGEWVLRQACAQAARWRKDSSPHPPLRVAVNLSTRQLAHPGLLAGVRSALEDSGLPAEALTLELTESALMADPDRGTVMLEELKQLGVSISLDDFGTGYSSLGYLRRFPVDVVKVDRSFVQAVGERRYDARLVAAIYDVAHSLGLTVVAEGIETPQQLEVLRRFGYSTGQGFLFGAPAATEQLEALVRGNRIAETAGLPS